MTLDNSLGDIRPSLACSLARSLPRPFAPTFAFDPEHVCLAVDAQRCASVVIQPRKCGALHLPRLLEASLSGRASSGSLAVPTTYISTGVRRHRPLGLGPVGFLLEYTMAPVVSSRHVCRLEAGLLPTPGEEKTTLAIYHRGSQDSEISGRPPTPTRRMALLRGAVCAVLVCFILGFSLTAAANIRPLTCSEEDCDIFHNKAPYSQKDSKLSQILHSASPDALHDFLHKYLPNKYQHGVYETDDEAVEALLQAENVGQNDQSGQPTAFPSLPQLVRRQEDGGNGTIPTSSLPPETTTGGELR